MHYASYLSPVGRLLLTAEGDCLTGLWPSETVPEGAAPGAELPVLEQTKKWLDRYFAGEKPEMDIPVDPKGTAFQKQVWQLLLDIDYGQTRTYGALAREMARKMGKERMSAQAVGQAVGKNPISILIPCHRCVGANGQMTGYAWGVEKKVWLLRHEGLTITDTIIQKTEE